jgi:hypothetical protein
VIELTLSSYPAPAEHVRGRCLDREAVVVLPDRGEVKVLNEVGAQIWLLADGTRSVRDIVVALCAKYEAPFAVIEADTLKFLAELQHKGLITIQV